MQSNVDIRELVLALGDSKVATLDDSLREIVTSPASDLVRSVANLGPSGFLNYNWIKLHRRRAVDEIAL